MWFDPKEGWSGCPRCRGLLDTKYFKHLMERGVIKLEDICNLTRSRKSSQSKYRFCDGEGSRKRFMRGIGTNGRIPGLWDLSIIIKHALRLILGNFNNADFIREEYILKWVQLVLFIYRIAVPIAMMGRTREAAYTASAWEAMSFKTSFQEGLSEERELGSMYLDKDRWL